MANSVPPPGGPRVKNKIRLRSKPLRFSQVLDQKIFLYPAGGGLILIALTLLSGSPFEWIVIFGYIFGMPFLFQYVKQRPSPVEDSPMSAGLSELDTSLRSGKLSQLGVFFEACLEDPLLEEVQVHQAIKCYKSASECFYLFQRIVSEINESDEYDIESLLEGGHRIAAVSFDRLKFCAVQFGQLSGIDSAAVFKKLQQLSGRSDLSQREAHELKASKEQVELRLSIIQKIFTALESTTHLCDAFEAAGRQCVESSAEGRVEAYAAKLAKIAGSLKMP